MAIWRLGPLNLSFFILVLWPQPLQIAWSRVLPPQDSQWTGGAVSLHTGRSPCWVLISCWTFGIVRVCMWVVLLFCSCTLQPGSSASNEQYNVTAMSPMLCLGCQMVMCCVALLLTMNLILTSLWRLTSGLNIVPLIPTLHFPWAQMQLYGIYRVLTLPTAGISAVTSTRNNFGQFRHVSAHLLPAGIDCLTLLSAHLHEPVIDNFILDVALRWMGSMHFGLCVYNAQQLIKLHLSPWYFYYSYWYSSNWIWILTTAINFIQTHTLYNTMTKTPLMIIKYFVKYSSNMAWSTKISWLSCYYFV